MSTETNKNQKSRIALQRVVALCITLVCLFVTSLAIAKDYSFVWSANPEPVEGYKLYYKQSSVASFPFDGTGSPSGPSPIDVGKVTSFTITGLEESLTYHFGLTAYNGNEESEFSEIISVGATEVEPEAEPEIAPVAIIVTPTLTGEAPFTLNFDGSSSTGTISLYSWSFGDGDATVSDRPLTSHIYQHPGTYTATLNVITASGLSNQSSVSITVTEPAAPPPAPPTNPTAVITSSSTAGNAPFIVQFDGSASSSAQPPIVSYSWDFGDGTIAEGTSVTHTYSTPGTYHATLTVRDSVGLTDRISTQILVNTAPIPPNQPPVSSFTATPTSGVAPLKVAFDGAGSSDPDGSISEYLWSFGDGSQALGVASKYNYAAIGHYTVTLKVTDNKGEIASSSQSVLVKAKLRVPRIRR